MPTQLERLARPFPKRYVSEPPQGKHGRYVAHDIVTQKMLVVLGAFDMTVGDWQYDADGIIEGGIVTITATIDGKRITVSEVGDCEFPKNKPTQGARMKDVASDGVKRCAMRLGCGLHLWSGEDFFLYDQLGMQEKTVTPETPGIRREICSQIVDVGVGGSYNRCPLPMDHVGPHEKDPNHDMVKGSRPIDPLIVRTKDVSDSNPASAESEPTTNHPVVEGEGSPTAGDDVAPSLTGLESDGPAAAQTDEPPLTVSPNKVQALQVRVSVLQARKVKVTDARKAAGLSLLKQGMSESEFAEWEALVASLERENP